ncbi:MAG: ABC transporter substrate-binding protein [Lentisphaeria bacterium]|nr:ABC transporter substrate-binding protein [Lentisphaeria bacterium]
MKNSLTLLSLLCLLLLAGCVPEELRLRRNIETDRTVRIGAVLPLTGANQRYGLKMLEGLRFALDEENARRGLCGKTVELITFDSGSTAAGAARATESAAAQNVVALIAGYDTAEVSAILPKVETLRLPTVIPMATNDNHVGFNDFVFRNIYTDRQQAETLAAYLWYWRKVMNIGILVDMSPKEEYSRNIAREVARYFGKLGGNVVCTAEFRGDDYEKPMRRIMTYAPRAIVLPVEAAIAAKMIKKLRSLGYQGIICGPDSWDSESFIQGLAGLQNPGDCVYMGLLSTDSKRREFREFQREFTARRFHTPGSSEIQSYDALKLLLIALSDAEDLRRFTRNWLTIQNHSGAAAVYSMRPGGDIDRTMYIKAVAPPNVTNPDPYARMLLEFQYSKLETYRDSLDASTED